MASNHTRQYIEQEKAEYLDDALPRLSLTEKTYNDQLHADLQRMAQFVGVNGKSDGFVASWLLACEVLEHLAGCLRCTEEEGRETGADFIEAAAWRLRLLGLWGEQNGSTHLANMPAWG